MALFLSNFTNKVDRKGRVSVPAPFRAALEADGVAGAVALFASPVHPCLEGFPLSFMNDLNDRLDDLALFSPEQDDLAMTIFAESVQLSIDGDGRIVLPPPLAAHAGIDGDAVFAGMGRKFQIWSPDAFDGRRRTARTKVDEKGLTLPRRREASGGGGSA